MSSVIEDELGRRFLAQWQRAGRITVEGDALWEPMRGARGTGDLTDRMNPREVLMGVLNRLVDAKAVVLPAGRDGWDRSVLPHVPRWIRLVGTPKPQPSRAWQSRVWHDLLLPVMAGRRALSVAQENLLTRLDELLKRSGLPSPSGKRSRSLHLTGDEKALDELLKTDAIKAIDADVLNVVDYPAPLCAVRIGDGDTVLILENEEPFYAALNGMKDSPSPFGALAYGRGGEIADSIRSIPWVLPGVTKAMYVGDLDRVGMTIMRRTQVAGATVGVQVLPALSLYREMVSLAKVMGYPDGWQAVRANAGGEFTYETLFEGFDGDLRAYLDRLWENNRRIPEEVLPPESFKLLAL